MNTITSPFAVLFVAIQNRLKSLQIESVQIFKTIEQDFGQLEDASRGINKPPVSWPCALIDIEDATFNQVGQNSELGSVNICIRVGFPPFSSSSSITPAPYRNSALYFYDLEQAIYEAFQGWTPGTVTVDETTDPVTTINVGDIFGKFIRVRAVTERRLDLIRVRCLYFSLTIDDNTAIQSNIMVSPITLNLTTQFNAIEE